MRREAIRGATDGLGDLSEEDMHQLIDGLKNRDPNEPYTEFCFAAVYVLRSLCGDSGPPGC